MHTNPPRHVQRSRSSLYPFPSSSTLSNPQPDPKLTPIQSARSLPETKQRKHSPLFEFHRYATRTSETYLIAAAAVAAVLSTPPPATSAEDQVPAEDRGTRPFEALEGWNEPYLDASEDDSGGHGDGCAGSGGAVRRAAGDTTAAAVTGIGVPIEEVEWTNDVLAGRGCGGFEESRLSREETRQSFRRALEAPHGRYFVLAFFQRLEDLALLVEGGIVWQGYLKFVVDIQAVARTKRSASLAPPPPPPASRGLPEQAEEAWSMLVAGLLYGRDGGVGGGRDRRERALSLDFFVRMVRALGRHLAPVSVPSPLVRCGSIIAVSEGRGATAVYPREQLWMERRGRWGTCMRVLG